MSDFLRNSSEFLIRTKFVEILMKDRRLQNLRRKLFQIKIFNSESLLFSIVIWKIPPDKIVFEKFNGSLVQFSIFGL